MNSNYEKLEELIKDDNKLVTIVSLAHNLNISFKESSEILKNYIDINKANHHTTYVLNGKLKGEDKLSVHLVKEKDLAECKQLYEEGVKGQVFSVQKSEFINSNWIALVNIEIQSSDKLSPAVVIGKNCVKRVLVKKTLPPPPPPCVKGKSTIFAKKPTAPDDKLEANKDAGNQPQQQIKTTTSPSPSIGNNSNSKTKDKNQKKASAGTLASFFTNISNKNETKKKSSVSRQNGSASESSSTSKIVNDTVKSNEEKITASDVNKNLNQSGRDLFDSSSEEDRILKDLYEENPKDENKIPGKSKKTSLQKQSNNIDKMKSSKKTPKSTTNSQKSIKKRKRIIEDTDSEDDIFGSDKSDKEDVKQIPTDEEPVVKPLPPKNRRRKAVEKTYEDEDGFIVTQTEYIYVSPSEDDEPVPKIPKLDTQQSAATSNGVKKEKAAVKNIAKSKKKNTSSSGVQKTIMNFFQRK